MSLFPRASGRRRHCRRDRGGALSAELENRVTVPPLGLAWKMLLVTREILHRIRQTTPAIIQNFAVFAIFSFTIFVTSGRISSSWIPALRDFPHNFDLRTRGMWKLLFTSISFRRVSILQFAGVMSEVLFKWNIILFIAYFDDSIKHPANVSW